VLHCQECGRRADERAEGWRGYRVDEPYADEPPELAWYCPRCADRELGQLRMAGQEVDELSNTFEGNTAQHEPTW
jgi:hypothetical protein